MSEKEMERLYYDLIREFEEPQREGLADTPRRAAKAMRFLTEGYNIDYKTVVNKAIFNSDTDEMVIVKNIELYSLCEHHLLPFFGKCHVAYIPKGKIIGLSKIPRIVDVFSKRLQISLPSPSKRGGTSQIARRVGSNQCQTSSTRPKNSPNTPGLANASLFKISSPCNSRLTTTSTFFPLIV